MTYDRTHLYLTAHWLDSREPNEGGQIGIRFDSPATSVSQSMVDACKPAFQTFWQAADTSMPSWYGLKFLRLAAIDVNGKYVPGTFSRDASFGAGMINSALTSQTLPLQVACATTLLTDRPRGPGSHGRVYFPPLAAALGSDGRWTSVAVNNRSAAVATLLTSLNSVILAAPGNLPAFAAVFSQGGRNQGPIRAFVTGVKTGTRPDVQRRRAKSMAEVYGSTSAVTTP